MFKKKQDSIPARTLCLDPGHTTGVAVFDKAKLTEALQVSTIEDKQILWYNTFDLIKRTQPTLVVCEDYKVYHKKLEAHSFSPVLTLRLIGGIEFVCHQLNIPIKYQMAATAKGFCTDEKLKRWGFWQTGLRHSRDAIRHGCYSLLF